MVVCKITLNNQPGVDYTNIIEKVLNTGDFIITAAEDDNYEIFYASEKEEINEAYIRKALRKYKVDYMIHVYDLSEKLDFDLYTNQWVVTHLDKQLKIKLEKESQPGLQQIKRRLDLLDRLTDEMIEAKRKYEEKAAEQTQDNGIKEKDKEDQNG